MANLGKVVYLSEQQKKELFANNTITVDGVTINYSDNDIYATPGDESAGPSLYCTATLSSSGWYRILKTANVSGSIIHVFVCIEAVAEVHEIDFCVSGGVTKFTNELSVGNQSFIDKIRFTTKNTILYIDIHYNSSTAKTVNVNFEAFGYAQLGNTTAESLQSVADAPSGETVVSEYGFVSNTNGDVTSSYSITKSTGRLLTLDSAYRYGKVVHMQITAASSSAASEGSNIATGTLNGAKPSVRVLAAAYYDNRIAIIMINTDGAITVRLSKGSMESSYTVTFGFTFICS